MYEDLTEKEARKIFEEVVPRGCFSVHKECAGTAKLMKKIKRLFAEWDDKSEQKGGRIDFILEPTPLLIERGWKLGCVGVEIKSSKMLKNHVGRAVAQCLDYQACSYELPNGETELSMIFLYPYRCSKGLLGSIMLQEGLGFVRYFPDSFKFQLQQANSNEPVFSYDLFGNAEVKPPRFGKRFGHR